MRARADRPGSSRGRRLGRGGRCCDGTRLAPGARRRVDVLRPRRADRQLHAGTGVHDRGERVQARLADDARRRRRRRSPARVPAAPGGELEVGRAPRLEAGPPRARPPRTDRPEDGVSAFVGAPSWSPVTQMLYDGGVVEHREGNELTGTVGIAIGPKCALTRRWFQVTGTGTEPEPLVAGISSRRPADTRVASSSRARRQAASSGGIPSRPRRSCR